MKMILLAIVTLFGGVMLALLLYTQSFAADVEAKFPPLGEFVQVGDLKIHYVIREPEEAPAGPPVVLIHGMSANSRDMLAALAQPLVTRGLKVIAFDRPGRGYSERGPENGFDPAVQADLIAGALDALGVERAILVGHSWGGALVTAFGVRHPEKTAGIVDLAGATHAWGGGPSWYNQIAAAPVVGSLFTHTLVSVVGPMLLPSSLAGAFDPDPVPTGYSESSGMPLLFRPQSFRNNAFDHYHLNDILEAQSKTYHQLKAPLVIITGDADPVVNYSIHSKALHAQVPHSKLTILEGAGHMVHHVFRDRIADEIAKLTQPMVQEPATE